MEMLNRIMQSLSNPKIDDFSVFEHIVANKNTDRKKRLNQYKNFVFERYNDYENNKDSLESIMPSDKRKLPETIKNDLLSCYSDNVTFRQVRKQILGDGNKCPYCTINTATTIDHYFDKIDYPEFSVYSRNLIRSCADCNQKKGTKVFDKNGNRQYLHFYFDVIPEDQFLYISFIYDPVFHTTEIKLSLDFSECAGNTTLIRNHFTNLNLDSQFTKQIQSHLSIIVEIIKNAKKDNNTLKEIISTLEYIQKSYMKKYGNNYWKTSMYKGLLLSKEYLSKLYSDL